MPKLREYTQQLAAPSNIPNRRIDPAQYEVGRSITNLGKSAYEVQAVEHQLKERKDLSNLEVATAEARRDLTTGLTEHVNSGGVLDDDANQKFDNNVGERLAKLQDGMQTSLGRERAAQVSGVLSAHFFETRDQQKILSEGALAKTNFLAATDINRNVLLADPMQLDSVLQLTEAALSDPNGQYAKIPATARVELLRHAQNDAAKSAAQGYIDIDPNLAKEFLMAGKMDRHLSADDKATLLAQADTHIRARELEDERLRKKQQEAIKEESHKVRDDMVTRMFAPTENSQPVTAREIASAKLTPEDREHVFHLLKNGDGAKDDPAVVNALFHRIHAAGDDPNRIRSDNELFPFVGRGLSIDGLTKLQKQLKDVRDPNNQSYNAARKSFLTGFRSQITKSTQFIADPKGDEQYYNFNTYVDQTLQRARDNGEDVFDYLTPNSPKYLGRPEVLKMFQRTPQQVIQEQAAALRAKPGTIDWPTAAQARQPGETAQQYLERMKKGK